MGSPYLKGIGSDIYNFCEHHPDRRYRYALQTGGGLQARLARLEMERAAAVLRGQASARQRLSDERALFELGWLRIQQARREQQQAPE